MSAKVERRACIHCRADVEDWIRGWDGEYRCVKHADRGPGPDGLPRGAWQVIDRRLAEVDWMALSGPDASGQTLRIVREVLLG